MKAKLVSWIILLLLPFFGAQAKHKNLRCTVEKTGAVVTLQIHAKFDLTTLGQNDVQKALLRLGIPNQNVSFRNNPAGIRIEIVLPPGFYYDLPLLLDTIQKALRVQLWFPYPLAWFVPAQGAPRALC